ncbi:MAG: MaoC family dehydratase [Thermoleophilia bacterium]
MPSTPTAKNDLRDLMAPFVGLMSWPTANVAGSWQHLMETWTQAWLSAVAPRTAPAPVAAPAQTEELPPFGVYPPGRTVAELSVGDSASITRRFSQAEVEAFARLSGDDNPAHVDEEWAAGTRLGGRVVHGMLTAGLISAVLGTQLPGPGSIYMSQTLRWTAPVRPGDLLTATATVKEIIAEKGRVVLETVVTCDGAPVMIGEALVMPPPAPESSKAVAPAKPAAAKPAVTTRAAAKPAAAKPAATARAAAKPAETTTAKPAAAAPAKPAGTTTAKPAAAAPPKPAGTTTAKPADTAAATKRTRA